MPRFVILEHDHPVLHWDLMLEAGDVLETWRLVQPPQMDCIVDATELSDHRLIYLDYEGPVSDNRGCVLRWDFGLFTEEAESTPTARVLIMNGARLRGCAALTQVDGANWRFRLTR